MIYAAEHFSTAMLEMLVYWKRALPPNQHYLDIAIPAGLSYEVVTADLLPDWHAGGGNAARLFGHEWYVDKRSAVLLVPSMVARMERNIIINTGHADFPRIKPGLETPLPWDQRLFE